MRAGQKKGEQRKAVNFKFIDMSSDGQSDDDSQKENFQRSSVCKSVTNGSRPVCRPCTIEETTKVHNGTSYNTKSATPLKELQFSTLSLEEPSMAEYDQQIKYLNGERNDLMKQNEDLRRLNSDLQREIQMLLSKSNVSEQRWDDYQQRCAYYEKEIGELKGKLKNAQLSYGKMQKEYENKLLNFQLPGSKSWTEESERLHVQVREKVKAISTKYVNLLAKQKMNEAVLDIIGKFVKQLIEINHKNDMRASNNSLINQFTSTHNKSIQSNHNRSVSYRSTRMGETLRGQVVESNVISEDYRLLQKSIEKLKTMQKQIEHSSGSYLKRKVEQEGSFMNRSVGLDQSSIVGLDRSKSRRKRIFQ